MSGFLTYAFEIHPQWYMYPQSVHVYCQLAFSLYHILFIHTGCLLISITLLICSSPRRPWPIWNLLSIEHTNRLCNRHCLLSTKPIPPAIPVPDPSLLSPSLLTSSTSGSHKRTESHSRQSGSSLDWTTHGSSFLWPCCRVTTNETWWKICWGLLQYSGGSGLEMWSRWK